MRRRRIGQKHWWTELSCALCAHRIARSIGLWARSCGRAVVSWKLGKPCPRSATWVINVSWMARNKCQHASQPRRLAVLTLRPVLWSVSYIALCSGGTPEDTYSPDCLDPHTPDVTLAATLRSHSLASPFSNTQPNTSIWVYLSCFVSRNLLLLHHSCSLLCRLPQGSRQEQTQAT
jgi:hypothetical protein